MQELDLKEDIDSDAPSIVGFFDIIGFKNRVERIPDKGFIHNKDFKKVLSDLRLIQEALYYKTKDKLFEEGKEAIGLKVLAFSDCVSARVPLSGINKKYWGEYDLTLIALNQWAIAQIDCLQKELLVRGGIDVGQDYCDGESIVVSKAHIKAYALEQFACWPVFALSESLVDWLRRSKCRNDYDDDPLIGLILKTKVYTQTTSPVKIEKYLSAKNLDEKIDCRNVEFYQVSEEENDLYFLDYLNIARMTFDDETDFCIFLRKHKQLIEEQIKSWENSSSIKILKKYLWMACYHNRYVGEHKDLTIRHSYLKQSSNTADNLFVFEQVLSAPVSPKINP